MDAETPEHTRAVVKQRPLGDSGATVSSIGLGGNIFGHFCDKQETQRIMAVALDNGINFVDTADVYSDGLSEEYIGSAIAGQRDSWFIASKVGVESDGFRRGSGTREKILSKVEDSLTRLGTDYIDLYQLHHFDPVTPLEESLGALHELVQAGKVRYIGACNYSGADLQSSVIIGEQVGMAKLSSVQNLYHVLKRDIEEDVLPALRRSGVGLIAYGVLARGILTGRYSTNIAPPQGSRGSTSDGIRADLDPEVLTVVDALHEFAQDRNHSVAQLALAWPLHRPEVSSVLAGVRDEEQLLGLIPAGDWELSKSELEEIEHITGDTHRFDHLPLGARLRSEQDVVGK